jgi:acyl-CoA-dependent ceramide synthase
MTFELKTYYLMQAAYWLQQMIILIAKVEKPRKDFKELVAHVSWHDGGAAVG